MKLRIKGPSLRLRLTQGEVHALATAGRIEERVPFGAGSELIYRLQRDAAATQISAALQGAVIEIRVPEQLANAWCTSEQVTLAQAQPVAGGALQITLEKDFACLAPRADEDESDNYPHPEAASGKSC